MAELQAQASPTPHVTHRMCNGNGSNGKLCENKERHVAHRAHLECVLSRGSESNSFASVTEPVYACLIATCSRNRDGHAYEAVAACIDKSTTRNKGPVHDILAGLTFSKACIVMP